MFSPATLFVFFQNLSNVNGYPTFKEELDCPMSFVLLVRNRIYFKKGIEELSQDQLFTQVRLERSGCVWIRRVRCPLGFYFLTLAPMLFSTSFYFVVFLPYLC